MQKTKTNINIDKIYIKGSISILLSNYYLILTKEKNFLIYTNFRSEAIGLKNKESIRASLIEIKEIGPFLY